MSLDATRWAWRQALKPSVKLVLLSIADRANDQCVSWPSQSRIELDTGLDRKTVIRAILELESLKLISISRNLGAKSVYTCSMKEEIEIRQTSPKNGTSPNLGTSPKNGTPQSQKRDTPSPKNGTPTSPKNGTQNLPLEPTNESTNEPTNIPTPEKNGISPKLNGKTAHHLIDQKIAKSKPKTELTAADLKGELDEQTATDFLSHRKHKKARLTQTAWDGIRREIEKSGLSLQDGVETMMNRGWTGFNHEWLNNNGQNQRKQQNQGFYDDIPF